MSHSDNFQRRTTFDQVNIIFTFNMPKNLSLIFWSGSSNYLVAILRVLNKFSFLPFIQLNPTLPQVSA